MRRTTAAIAVSTALFVVASGALPALAAPPASSPTTVTTRPVESAPVVDPEVTEALSVAGGGDGAAVVPSDGRPVARPEGVAAHAGPATIARAFVAAAAPVYGTDGSARTLQLDGVRDLGGDVVVRFQQLVDGVPVYGGELAVQLTSVGSLVSITGETARATTLPAATVTAAQAQATALRVSRARSGVGDTALTSTGATRWVYDPVLVGEGSGAVRPVWQVVVTGPPARGIVVEVLVDAATGAVADVIARTPRLERSICDNQNSTWSSLAAGAWCTPSDVNGFYLTSIDSSHPEAVKAWDDLGAVSDFFGDVLGVDLTQLVGLDPLRPYHQRQEPVLTATVNHCEQDEECPYPNAFWIDADPRFRPGGGRVYPGGQVYLGRGLEASEDVVAHEVAHGVTSAVNALKYQNQSGAINESMSDVFGQLSQLYDAGSRSFVTSRDRRWLIGEQLDVPGLRGAVRSMSNPSTSSLAAGYPQPNRMSSKYWQRGPADNGGVHANNGVGNKTAFLIARGGTFNGYKIRGIGERSTARLYWRAQNLLTSGANYRDLAVTLAVSCNRLFGKSSGNCRAVRAATAATEIAKARVKLTATSWKVKAGKSRTVRARLVSFRGGGQYVRASQHVKLVLLRKSAGSSKWKRVSGKHVTTAGRTKWSVHPSRTTQYRVKYAGSTTLGLKAATTTKTLRVHR